MDLNEFAASEPARVRPKWVDQLPDEVLEQIVESGAPPGTICRWLESIGHPGCTPERLRPLLARRGR